MAASKQRYLKSLQLYRGNSKYLAIIPSSMSTGRATMIEEHISLVILEICIVYQKYTYAYAHWQNHFHSKEFVKTLVLQPQHQQM
jgi:hypothetical protein